MTLRGLALALLFFAASPALAADTDGDGIDDSIDVCPYAADPAQLDSGGVLGLAPDGIGDACQCGDVSDDGLPNVVDVARLRRALIAFPPPLARPDKCDVIGSGGGCDLADFQRLRAALTGNPATPLAQLCAPALAPAPVCGDGIANGSEDCDGADLGGETCATQGYASGSLSCTPGCVFNTIFCSPYVGQGGTCAVDAQCVVGLSCEDDTCCTSQCAGTCEGCDVAGALGSCTPHPNGADPDSECGALSCNGFFSGWLADSCYRKSDVSASAATCNGAGACRTAAQSCPSQPPGPIATTCHATCQDPNFGTCTGTTAGACTNVNPGTQTCGVGVCQVIVGQCEGGAPKVCVPNGAAAQPETCNAIDDDCTGTADDANLGDGLEPNLGCGTERLLAQVGSDQTITLNTPNLSPLGDVDYYRIHALETDNSCGCSGFPGTDEDYDLRVTLTAPANLGSYRLCTANACGSVSSNCVTVAQGTTQSLTLQLDGQCQPGTTDSYDVYVRVDALTPMHRQCVPYTLSYFFDAGLCR